MIVIGFVVKDALKVNNIRLQANNNNKNKKICKMKFLYKKLSFKLTSLILRTQKKKRI